MYNPAATTGLACRALHVIYAVAGEVHIDAVDVLMGLAQLLERNGNLDDVSNWLQVNAPLMPV